MNRWRVSTQLAASFPLQALQSTEGELAYGLVLAITGDTAVHVLKAGMTNLDVAAPGPFECVPDQARRLLVAVAERSYKRWQDPKRRRLYFRRR